MATTPPAQVPPAVNEVRLGGRLAAAPVTTVLPSGDTVVTFRLVVPRRGADRRPPSVDTLECAVWRAATRRRVSTWTAGDLVELQGSVRRRFWRGPTGPRSRYEIEVREARRHRA